MIRNSTTRVMRLAFDCPTHLHHIRCFSRDGNFDKAQSNHVVLSAKEVILSSIQRSIRDSFTTHVISINQNVVLSPSTKSEFGDYQCNIAMILAKQLGMNPRLVAEKIVLNLDMADIVDNVTVSGPGFINMKLSKTYVMQKLNAILNDKSGRLGIPLIHAKEKKRIVVDFSSPNIAKEMHVGHLRSTIIGDSICNLLEFRGHHVIRLNHIGDWGTQFGMLIHYMKEMKMQSSDIAELGDFYKAAKKRFDESKDFQNSARKEVVKLQKGVDFENMQKWKSICKISRDEFQYIYDLLGVKNLEERGESFYNSFLDELLNNLSNKNMIVNSDGASCIFLPGYLNKDGSPQPLIMRKSDGGYLYATTDVAAVRHRISEENADTIIYVTDSGQSQHFKMVFDVVNAAGFIDKHKEVELVHVPFGLVLGEDGKKFKTRSGDVVKLRNLLDEAVSRAEKVIVSRLKDEKMTDKHRHTARVIGIAAVKYADLSMTRDSNYKFSFDKMLSLNGNTAPYMLYVYARISGIIAKTIPNQKSILAFDYIHLASESEILLAKQIIRFSDVLGDVEKNLYPSKLCDYLYELSHKFNQFYEKCPVVTAESKELQESRAALCRATAETLKVGLEILGIETLHKL